MFTGIVTNFGEVVRLVKDENQDLLISLKIQQDSIPSRNLDIGCSIACDGVCLTLVKKNQEKGFYFFDFRASNETVEKTNIKRWFEGELVNVEFALRMGDELGGHLVSGHVDGIAIVSNIKADDESHIFTFEIDNEFRKFICQKGSVVLNGVSLTVNDVFDNKFQINVIDHTLNNTNFKNLKVGDKVNLEIDQVARYLDNINKYK